MQPAFQDRLSVLPDWQGLSRVASDEARWQERFTALIEYRGSGQDWPRHKANIGEWSMSSVCGCTPSVTKPAAENWIRQKRLLWMSGCQAGRQGGPGAESPRAFPWLIRVGRG